MNKATLHLRLSERALTRIKALSDNISHECSEPFSLTDPVRLILKAHVKPSHGEHQ